MNYITIYSKSHTTQIDVMDNVVLKTGAKVVAASNDALYNDTNHEDVSMVSITYETELDVEKIKDVVKSSKNKEDCFVCKEENWHC